MSLKKDSHGMIRYCIAYRHGQRLGEIEMEQIRETLQQPDTFVWLALHEPNAELLLHLQYELDLHELAIEDAQAAHQRPKLEQYGSSLFLVVKTALMWDEEVHLGETHIFAGSRFFVTVRHGPSITYSKVRERLESAPVHLAMGPAMAVYGVMDFIVDNYHPILHELQERFDRLEADIVDGKSTRATIRRLYRLKRELLVLRGAAAPVLDVTDELMRLHPDVIPKEARPYFRDIHDHVMRLVATADEMREMLTAAMQVNLAFISVEQNESVRRLAGWGAILALPTVVFSLYGMNFKIMPELDFPYGYPLVGSVTALACLWLYRRFKRVGWL